MPARRFGVELLGRFPARRSRRVIAGNPALNPSDRFSVPVFGDLALRDFSLAGEFVNGQANLFKRYLGRCRNFGIEQLAVFFQVLED
jgi:hypothetical protein